jgi:hypothetical protein
MKNKKLIEDAKFARDLIREKGFVLSAKAIGNVIDALERAEIDNQRLREALAVIQDDAMLARRALGGEL